MVFDVFFVFVLVWFVFFSPGFPDGLFFLFCVCAMRFPRLFSRFDWSSNGSNQEIRCLYWGPGNFLRG